MKTSEESHIIPDGWAKIELKDIVLESQIGLVKSTGDQNSRREGVGYVKMNNITQDGKILLDDLVHVHVSEEELNHYHLLKGDILFNTRNSVELVGKTGIINDSVDNIVYNNNIMRIRTKGVIFPDFLNYQMIAP